MSAPTAGVGERDSAFVTPQPSRRFTSRILTATMPLKEAKEANTAVRGGQSPATSPLRPVLPRPRSQSAAPSFTPIAGLTSSPRPSPQRSSVFAPLPSLLRSSLSGTALFPSAAGQPNSSASMAALSSLPSHRPSIVPQLAEEYRQKQNAVAAPTLPPTTPPQPPLLSPPPPPIPPPASPSTGEVEMAAQCAMLAARLREREEELMNVRRELVESREEVTTYRAMKEWRDDEKGREQGGWQREKLVLTDKLERLAQQQATERKHHEDEVSRLTADIHTLLATIDHQHSATQQLEQHSAHQQQTIAQLQSQLLVHETTLSASSTRESLLQHSIQQLSLQHTQRLTQQQSEHEAEVKSMRLESEQTERLLQAQVAAVRVALLEAQADADASRTKRLQQARRHERLQQESRERVQAMEKDREAERRRLASAEAEVEESRARLAAMHTESAEQTERTQQEQAKLSALLLEARHQMGELTSTNRKLQAELEIWQSHKDQDAKTHQLQVLQLESQLQRAQDQVKSAQQDFDDKLAAQQLDQQHQQQQHQATLAHLTQQVNSRTQQLTTLQHELATLNDTHTTLSTTHHTAIQSLESALAELQQRCALLTEERDAAVRCQSVEAVGREVEEGRLAEARRKWVEAEDEARRWQEEAERAELERVRVRGEKVREKLEAERKERKARDDRERREWLERVTDAQGAHSAAASPRLEWRTSSRRRPTEYHSSGTSSSSEEKQQILFDSKTPA